MKNFKLIVLVILFGILTACNSDKTKKEAVKETPVYSVVGTWELLMTQIIDGADTTLRTKEDRDVNIRKVVAANNTFSYMVKPENSYEYNPNSEDVALTIRGDYKQNGNIYYEYLSDDSEIDKLLIQILGESSIYRVVVLNEKTWVLELMNTDDINKSVTQYWKRL